MTKQIISFTLFFALFGTISLQAQNAPAGGKFTVAAGIGLVPTFVADDATVTVPPVSFRAGYQISPVFNLSAFAAYSNSSSNSSVVVSDGQLSRMNNRQFMAGVRGEVRKDFDGKFDVYGGGMLGINRADRREFDSVTGETIVRKTGEPTPFDPNEKTSGLIYSGFVGGTYYLHKNFGLFAEVGYGVSLLNTGFSLRF